MARGVWGVDMKAVSEMLGHADVGITLKIYHHVNIKAIREMHREYNPICTVDNLAIRK
jgi:site-specific recombinase XerD